VTVPQASLTGKRIVLAGGGGGMGGAIARVLVEQGASVVLADRDQARLDAAAAELRSSAVSSVRCDLTSEADVQALAATAGDVHGLVNAQGISPFVALHDMTLDVWRDVIDVNLTSVFLTCRELGGTMAALGRGSIVNISSTAGIAGVPEMTAYTASKHGVIGLTRALSLELGRRGVRANCICPGATLTPMLLSTPSEYREARVRRVPLRRLADPSDQANVVAFLLSDASAYITGAAIPVDGGVSALAPGTAERDLRGEG
jgi:NAD(P)-dependent dehydrogenase (short-subunit alcohol dehydrogenase family)